MPPEMQKILDALDLARAFAKEADHSDRRFQQEVQDKIQEAITSIVPTDTGAPDEDEDDE